MLAKGQKDFSFHGTTLVHDILSNITSWTTLCRHVLITSAVNTRPILLELRSNWHSEASFIAKATAASQLPAALC